MLVLKFQIEVSKSHFLLLPWSPYFALRQPIWVVWPHNLGDRQILSTYAHVGNHTTVMSLSHLFYEMLTHGHHYFGDLV